MKKSQRIGIALALLTILISACSDEILRVRFKEAGEKKVKFQYGGEQLEFWTDFDVEYDAQPEIYYEIEIYRGDEIVEEVICDPFDVEDAMMTRDVEVRGISKQSYLATMRCEGGIIPKGDLTIYVKFIVEEDLATIFRADLVLKGEN